MVTIEQRGSAHLVLGQATVQDLRDSLQGELVLPGDTEYDIHRRVFNAMIDRYPALIVRPVSTDDVIATIGFARSHDIPVAVRGGGHSVAGHGTIDDGLVMDFSLMKQVEVDPVNLIARVQPGVKIGELIPELEKYGLVSPTGTASDTGIAGLTLGGGYGWLSGRFGLAVDNLVGAEVVTADGRVICASVDEHPDLFWALRGGSGNFGVVTSFEMRLYELDEVYGGMLLYPFDRAREVLRFYRELTSTSPDELTTYAALVTAPDGQKMIALLLCYSGPPENREEVVGPIRAFGPPVADLTRPMKYSEMNTLIDAANPPGLQNYWKWNGLREVSDDAIEVIVDAFDRVPSALTAIIIDQVNGAASRVSPTAIAFAHRDAPHGLVIISMWSDPADGDVNIRWTRELAAATEQFSTGGAYVNGIVEEKARAAYGVNYERLVEIKNRYDPTNFFRHNQNIKPTG